MEISLEQLISTMGEPHRVMGSSARTVRNVRPIDNADEDSLCFCKFQGQQALDKIRNSRALVVVCSDTLDVPDSWGKTIIQVRNPRLTYGRLLARYFYQRPPPGIHPTAVVESTAKIGEKVSIGPSCYVGECEIGDGTIIDGHVHIYARAKIGKGVIIHAGAVIGAPAIAFERNDDGELEWFPQVSGVSIEDNVEIGSNSVICRGSLNDTVIASGTKIDNLATVAHGSVIGRNCIIAGGVVVCGSVRIGDRTWVGPHACIRESVTIGDRVTVGAGSVVHKNVGDDLVVTGSPARPTITPSRSQGPTPSAG